MSELIDAIVKWPIIIQGALGSALFWLVLLIAQKAAYKLLEIYSHKSKAARKSWLVSSQFKYALGMGTLGHIEKAHFFSVLIYRSTRHSYKALMWLVLGLIANTFESPLGIVGYLGALVYLLRAFEVVSPNRDTPDVCKKKFIEITDELKRLK